MHRIPVFLATVCLERNRWRSRLPSFKVSEWLPRFRSDGFDGIELWEPHYLMADATERERLEAAGPLAVYNSYVGFEDTQAAARLSAAQAAIRLRAAAVKYNVGRAADQLDLYRRHLLAWADQLPTSCILLCECHDGTALEKPEVAAAFFAPLDPERFRIIVHITGDADALAAWFASLGPRIAHLHVQLRHVDPQTEAGRHRLEACVRVVRAYGFRGTASIEFTRGIGPNESMDLLYTNARVDLAAFHAALRA